MKSLKVSFFAAILLLVFCAGVYAAAPLTVQLNGQTTKFVPLVKEYVNFLTINELSNIITNKIEYNTYTKEVKINNFPVNLKSDPIIKSGKIYLPVDSIVSAAGGTVSFDARENILKITMTKKQTSTYTKPVTIKVTPVKTETVTVTTPASTPSPAPAQQVAADDDSKPFIPRSDSNGIYKVTVTNVEKASVLKGNYPVKAGFKYIIVYFSQQNITDRILTYAGRFYMLDDSNNEYRWVSGISNYWAVYFKPNGICFAYFVFEIPLFAQPAYLCLDLGNNVPVRVALSKEPTTTGDYMFPK